MLRKLAFQTALFSEFLQQNMWLNCKLTVSVKTKVLTKRFTVESNIKILTLHCFFDCTHDFLKRFVTKDVDLTGQFNTNSSIEQFLITGRHLNVQGTINRRTINNRRLLGVLFC